jgi:DNA-binding transcriptional ArsR family regulator
MPRRKSRKRGVGAAPPTFEQMVKAINHPVRVKTLKVLLNRPANPSAIATDLDVPLSTVSYHVRVLESAGLVEIIDEEAVRGSVAHFFSVLWPDETKAFLDRFKLDFPTADPRDG